MKNEEPKANKKQTLDFNCGFVFGILNIAFDSLFLFNLYKVDKA